MTGMYCINCGETLVESANYCGACGTKIRQVEQRAVGTEPTPDQDLSAEECFKQGNECMQSGEHEQAVALFRRAAEAGFADAQKALGKAYFDGQGVPEDKEEGFRWFKVAEKQGLPVAQFNLALMHHTGAGVPQDNVKAAEWLRKAADQGHVKASELLGMIEADKA